jgi:glycosyltransferase involved in cell wall biosynthesis
MKISYLVTVHNEDESFDKLLSILKENIDMDDEVIVLDDFSDNPKTLEIFEKYKSFITKFIQHKLNNDFSEHKNVGLAECKGDYVFNLDSDEYPTDVLIQNLKEILTSNPSIELYKVPRINIVLQMTQEMVTRYGWRVNEKGWINFPDHQFRIHKNDYPRIKWFRPVHEQITGFKVETELPSEEEYCLYHIKTAERQIKQNEFYIKNWSR